MSRQNRITKISRVVRHKPLQAGKFVSILLSLVLGVGGFLRIINAKVLFGDSFLADGQLLALILIPVVGLGLVCLVFVETLVTGYRSLRSDASIADQISSRPSYILIRGVEATIAVVGMLIILSALPTLFAESTPAPAGVGIMLLLMATGLGILCASLVRTTVDIFIYTDTS